MGLFLISVATAIVVLQSTLILSNREPNLWVFSLLQRKNILSEYEWSNITHLMHSIEKKEEFKSNVLPWLHIPESALNSPMATCLENKWISAHNHHFDSLESCRIWHHAPQEISSIFNGSTWSPHIILLVIASIHLLLCFSNSQEHLYTVEHQHPLSDDTPDEQKKAISTRIYHFPLSLSLFILTVLCLIIGLIASNRNSKSHLAILDAPTIIVGVILFLTTAWFLRIHDHPQASTYHDHWALIFQMQIIGVPLTVMMISAMGARFYTDTVSHFIFLSVAVNSLWLQKHLRTKDMIAEEYNSNITVVFLRLITIGMPLFSILTAQLQWGGANTWQQITVFMAFFSLAPLFFHSFYPNSIFDEGEGAPHFNRWTRMQARLGNLCSSAALGSTVINLALL